MQSFLNSDLITILQESITEKCYMKSLTCMVHMMTNDSGRQKVKCHVPLPCDQMPNCFTNVNVMSLDPANIRIYRPPYSKCYCAISRFNFSYFFFIVSFNRYICNQRYKDFTS